MEELQRRPGESAQEWLARLKQIDPSRLSEEERRSWELAVGYAKYQADKASGSPDGGSPPAGPP